MPTVITTTARPSPPPSHLYVMRDTMTNAWRLYWAIPGEFICVGAEGECSKRLFDRRRDAIAYGERAYKETAMPWRDRFPAPEPREG